MSHAILIRDVATGRLENAADYLHGLHDYDDEIVVPHETGQKEGVAPDALSMLLSDRPKCEIDPSCLNRHVFDDPFDRFTQLERTRSDKYAQMAWERGLWSDPADDWYNDERYFTARSVLAVGISFDPFADHCPSRRHEFADAEACYEFEDPEDEETMLEEFEEPDEEPAMPCQHGCDRTKRGTLGWWEIDNKDHRTWMNRRRSTGLSRAPKWQQRAGGRRQARQSIKHLAAE